MAASHVAWVDKPPRLLVHAFAGNAEYLMRLPASSDGMHGIGPPQRLTFGTGAESQVSAAANGRMAVGSTVRESHIWGVPIDDAGRPTGPARQLTAEFPSEVEPSV